MSMYKGFIPQNVAPKDARRIGIYDSKGNRVGQLPLESLTFPNVGEKLYSFGLLSDVHVQYDTALADLQRALAYLTDEENVDFTCICGDLTADGTAAQLTEYKNAVSSYLVYTMMGNHDCRANLMDSVQNYTGKPNYFSITHGNDVFIFVGNVADWTTAVLSNAELQWLYEKLEANRNKRCFLFEHIRPTNGCGNALGLYQRSTTDWGGTCGAVFESLLSHYKNIVFFHGHSHLKIRLQERDKMANYDNLRGSHSVHVSSLAVPRDDINGDGASDDIYAESEGCVVDVYENFIHLRHRDFAKGEFIPLGSLLLDTTLQTIPAGTYTDGTGTIKT